MPETQNRPGPNPEPSSKEKCSPNQALTHIVALPVQLATSSISEHLKGLGLKQSIEPPGDGMTWKCFEEVKNLLCDFRIPPRFSRTGPSLQNIRGWSLTKGQC